MNKKILELAEQAGLLHEPDGDGDVYLLEHATGELEKFAELIIKECAMFSMVITDDHYDVDALYRHFGVEE